MATCPSIKNNLIMKDESKLPPQWMLNLLRTFCPPSLCEEIEGDLIERYYLHCQSYGQARARWRLFRSVAGFFRPGILLRNKFMIQLNSLYMLSNYLKISLRVMGRNSGFTAINISGLVLGITGAILLFLWIHHEFSYDQFHQDNDRIHVAWKRIQENGQVNCWSITPRILAPTLEKEYAGVEHAVSFAKWDSRHLFTVGNTKLTTSAGVFTDPAFLKVLTFPMIKGDPATALEHPQSIVLTESFAKTLFGDQEPFGQGLKISQDGYTFEFTVTGILKDLPATTDFDFEYLISFQFLEGLGEKDEFWGNNSCTTLVKLRPGVDLNSFNDLVAGIEKKHSAESQHIDIFLYPLTKMRLYANFENGVPSGGRIDIMRMLGILGTCMILIACINFINLSTARAQRRAKEVAVRKVTGALRFTIISQFLLESMLTSAIAGVVAAGFAWLLLPYFNALVQEDIRITFSPLILGGFVILVGLVGILAGSYPAFYLSSFLPVRILKGATIGAGGVRYLRAALVVFQFGFAVTMIVAAIVVSKQIAFIQTRDTGYSRDHLLYIPITGDLGKNYNSFRNELLANEIAVSVTKTSGPLTEQFSGSTDIQWSGKNPEERTGIERIFCDETISKTTGVRIILGRDLDLQQFPSDSSAMLINETAWHLMGFKDPIGERIMDSNREYHIVGVVKDFVFTSPFRKVEPIILLGGKQAWSFNVVYMKLNPARSPQENIASLEKLVRKFNPEYPFEYQFADVEYQRKFDNMRKTLMLTTLFTSVAIFIACLGLLGLSIYLTESRLKEIGVRKVMGGSVMGITRLLGMASIKPVLIAIVLFLPVSWWAMSWWLESFAFRIPLDPAVFILAAVSIVVISVLTVAVQTLRAAKINPATILKNE
jgi:putative ABC transport system permease protein